MSTKTLMVIAWSVMVVGCGVDARPGPTWTASSYREQFAWTNPPAGCLTVCVVDGDGCAMAGPDGEHAECASGDDPIILDNGAFGTCVVEAKPCD